MRANYGGHLPDSSSHSQTRPATYLQLDLLMWISGEGDARASGEFRAVLVKELGRCCSGLAG